MYNDGATVLSLIQSMASAACLLGGITLLAWSLTEKLKAQGKVFENPALEIGEEVTRKAA